MTRHWLVITSVPILTRRNVVLVSLVLWSDGPPDDVTHLHTHSMSVKHASDCVRVHLEIHSQSTSSRCV